MTALLASIGSVLITAAKVVGFIVGVTIVVVIVWVFFEFFIDESSDTEW